MNKAGRHIAAAWLLFAVAITAWAQTPAPSGTQSSAQPTAQSSVALPGGVTAGPVIEGVAEYRLDNGLKVILFPDPSKPTATVNITYLVGSRNENYGETGMAHLLEHLIFKGSKNFPKPDVEFSRRGFKNNGTTWLDRTNYFSTFQATDDNLKWAIDWSADAMVNSFIARADLDSEMTVVRNEFEMRQNSPPLLMFERNQALLFDWHNYGNSAAGARSDIENVRIENLQAFYRTYYQPDNAVLIVAGRFEPSQTLRWIADAFGRIPKPARALPPQWTLEPTHDGERHFAIRRRGEVQIVTVAYRIPSGLHPDSLRIGFATDILTDTPNGRLHKAIVEPGMAAQVFGYSIDPKDPGFVIFGAVVKRGEPLERIRETIIEVVEQSFGKNPITEAELQRTRRQQRTAFDRVLANPEAFGVGLSEYVALGDWRLFFLTRDRLEKIDAKEVAQAAARYFVRDNRVTGYFVPEDAPLRAEIPPAPTATELLADYKPAEQGAVAEAFEPSQANIDKRTQIVRFGDLRIALLPKRNRGQTVNVQTVFRWGDVKTLTGRMIENELAAAMLARGTDKLTRQQIADEMTRLEITGGLTGFQTSRSHLPEALRLLAHTMRAAAFPANEFEQLQRQLVTSLSAQLDNPETISRDAMATHFNTYPPGDPRHHLPLKQRIDAIAKAPLAQVRSFHGEFFGTARGEVAIVGDFEAAEIEPLLRELFTGFSSKAPYERIERDYREVKPDRIVINTPDKENAVIRARIDLPLRDDDPDAPALTVANEIFGGGAGLSNRLMDRLRQTDGISYGAGSGLSLGSRNRVSSWTLGALVAPQNAAQAEKAIQQELERARRDGFTATEVDNAKNGILQARLVNRSNDGVLAGAWVQNLDLDRTFAFSQQFEDRLRTVTPEQVSAAFRKYIEPARMTFVLAGDAAKGLK